MSVMQFARETGISSNTLYSRIVILFGLRSFDDLTLAEVQRLKKPVKEKSVLSLARETGIPDRILRDRMMALYGTKKLDDLTPEQIDTLKIRRKKTPMKKSYKYKRNKLT